MMTERMIEQVESISTLPGRLATEVAGMTDEQLDTPYREDGWTIRQVVHHLFDSHANAYIRMKLIVTEEYPTLRPYIQDAWAELPDSLTMPVSSSLTALEALHQRWTYFLRALDHEAWTRSAFHPESGSILLRDFLDLYSRHGETHLDQIVNLKASKGW